MNVKVGDNVKIISAEFEDPEHGWVSAMHYFKIGELVTVKAVDEEYGTILGISSNGLVQSLHTCHYKKVNMSFTNK